MRVVTGAIGGFLVGVVLSGYILKQAYDRDAEVRFGYHNQLGHAVSLLESQRLLERPDARCGLMYSARGSYMALDLGRSNMENELIFSDGEYQRQASKVIEEAITGFDLPGTNLAIAECERVADEQSNRAGNESPPNE